MSSYIGIDNGVTGSIGIINDYGKVKEISLFSIPIRLQQDYTKTKKTLNRIQFRQLRIIFKKFQEDDPFVFLERPMINPGRWNATCSAIRADETTRSVLEYMNIPFRYIDSKEWQKALLPKGVKKKALKKASLDIGLRMFPSLKEQIIALKDADGILIAEWCRREMR